MTPDAKLPPDRLPVPTPPEANRRRHSAEELAQTAVFADSRGGCPFLGHCLCSRIPPESQRPGRAAPVPVPEARTAEGLEAPPAKETAPPGQRPVEPPAVVAPSPPEAAPPPPLLPPPPLARKEAVKGVAFTQALIKIIDDEVNKRLFGWRPNTIIFGKFGLTDNVNNQQLGVLEVARRTIVVLNENMTRFAITEAYNPRVNEAMNFLMVSPDKYWFPSASGKYREAMADLEQFIEDLRFGRARFYSRVDNLNALLGNYKDVLGSCYHNLVKDTEATAPPFPFSRATIISIFPRAWPWV
jgi:hypothetical protein